MGSSSCFQKQCPCLSVQGAYRFAMRVAFAETEGCNPVITGLEVAPGDPSILDAQAPERRFGAEEKVASQI